MTIIAVVMYGCNDLLLLLAADNGNGGRGEKNANADAAEQLGNVEVTAAMMMALPRSLLHFVLLIIFMMLLCSIFNHIHNS